MTPLSIRTPTRVSRSSLRSGVRIVFNKNDVVAKDFMGNDQNKEDVNFLLAKTAVSRNWGWEYDFYITYGDTVHSNDDVEVSFYENKEALEEADNRMICHINDIVKNTELSNICVRTVYCYVLVILLSFLSQFLNIRPTLKVTADFANGINRRLINVKMFSNIGVDKCLALPFFHTFTRSDLTCSFFRYSKSVWWKSWNSFPKNNELSNIMEEVSWTSF